jgi:hypothetical protein
MAYHIGRLWGIGRHFHPFEASSDDTYNQFVEECLSLVVKETFQDIAGSLDIPGFEDSMHSGTAVKGSDALWRSHRLCCCGR